MYSSNIIENLLTLPAFKDVSGKNWAISVALGVGGYLLPIFLRKIFSEEGDRYPLSNLRCRIVRFDEQIIKRQAPKIYFISHGLIMENLALAVFFTSLIILTKPCIAHPNSNFFVDNFCRFAGICSVLGTSRVVSSVVLSNLSKIFPRNHYIWGRIAVVLEKSASYMNLITPLGISDEE